MASPSSMLENEEADTAVARTRVANGWLDRVAEEITDLERLFDLLKEHFDCPSALI